MKKLMFILIACVASFALHAEEGITYLDRNLEVTTADQAMYQRTANLLDDGHYHVKVTYLDGETRMIGRYTDVLLENEEGWFVYYFASGNRESQGHFHNGERVGVWNRWDWKGNPLADRYYSDLSKEAHTGTTCEASILPGENGMQQYISENLKYPANAQANNIQGQVRLKFTVDAEGVVQDVEVAYSAHPFLTNAALEFVANMPVWQPALQNGVAYSSQHTLPLSFQLAPTSK